MATYRITDENNNVVETSSLGAWINWCEAFELYISTTINRVRIITIFLRYDCVLENETRLLFETSVFGGEMDGTTERYSTLDDAIIGHGVMIAKVYNTIRK